MRHDSDLMKDTEQIYSCKNLSISAFLYASGLQFIGAKKINGDFFFEFKPKEKAESLLNQYFAGTASVNPQTLFARLHDLRDLIFNQKN